jgi:hypothetical protein
MTTVPLGASPSLTAVSDPGMHRARSENPDAGKWSPQHRFAFRFCFIYFGFYITELWSQYWFPSFLQRWLSPVFNYAVHIPSQWLGTNVWGVCARSDGNLYRSYAHYCWINDIYWMVIASLAVAGLWTLVDRRRTEYRRLHDAFRVSIRYWLASSVWWYAWAKFAVWQFGKGFEDDELLTQFGDMAKNIVMWSTMGVSNTYSIFTAVGEALAVGFLFFRRTTTLGALLLIQIMGIVAILDILHEASVGERAVHYALLGVFLLAPDAKRLLDLYVFNRPVSQPVPQQRFFDWPSHRVWSVVVPSMKLLLLVGFLQNPLRFGKSFRGYYMLEPKPHELVGVFNVEEFVRNGAAEQARYGDTTAWRYLKLSAYEYGKNPGPPRNMTIRTWGSATKNVTLAVDSTKRNLSLTETVFKQFRVRDADGFEKDTSSSSTTPLGTLSYRWLDRMHLQLTGTVRKDSARSDSVKVTLRRLPNEQSTLWGGPGYDARLIP